MKRKAVFIFIIVFVALFTIIYMILENNKFRKYYKELEEFYANNTLFSYSDISQGDYTFEDLYMPGNKAYDYDNSGTMPSPDTHHSEVYLNNDDYDTVELDIGESGIILSLLKESTYCPLSKAEAYELGLLKSTEDGKFQNLTAVPPDIMFYYYSIYPESVMGEYYAIIVDIIRYDNEIYVVLMENNPIADMPCTTHKCIFKANSSKELYDYIDLIVTKYT